MALGGASRLFLFPHPVLPGWISINDIVFSVFFHKLSLVSTEKRFGKTAGFHQTETQNYSVCRDGEQGRMNV